MGQAHSDKAGLIEYPNDPQFAKASPGKIGMWIFLTTDAMSFSGLLIAYGILRATLEWPNPTKYLGIDLSAFATFILICSSVSMVFSIDACKRQMRKAMINWLALTALGGVIFLGIQVYEYIHLINNGITFNHFAHGNHLFGATFYAITGFHGLHVLTGTIYLFFMLKRAIQGKYDNGNYNELELAGLFWHFVDLVWILVFTFIYLL